MMFDLSIVKLVGPRFLNGCPKTLVVFRDGQYLVLYQGGWGRKVNLRICERGAIITPGATANQILAGASDLADGDTNENEDEEEG